MHADKGFFLGGGVIGFRFGMWAAGLFSRHSVLSACIGVHPRLDHFAGGVPRQDRASEGVGRRGGFALAPRRRWFDRSGGGIALPCPSIVLGVLRVRLFSLFQPAPRRLRERKGLPRRTLRTIATVAVHPRNENLLSGTHSPRHGPTWSGHRECQKGRVVPLPVSRSSWGVTRRCCV